MNVKSGVATAATSRITVRERPPYISAMSTKTLDMQTADTATRVNFNARLAVIGVRKVKRECPAMETENAVTKPVRFARTGWNCRNFNVATATQAWVAVARPPTNPNLIKRRPRLNISSRDRPFCRSEAGGFTSVNALSHATPPTACPAPPKARRSSGMRRWWSWGRRSRRGSIGAGQQHGEAVEAEGDPAVGRRAIRSASSRKPNLACASSSPMPSSFEHARWMSGWWMRIEPPPISWPLSTRS